ncbi:hypothetical protein QEJ31_07965 [Pigmentibacter sp. JX0631]|uniref:tetratricopeptide repeat protein n=1 Tax=Pigmentibacter sp. JX0631 TaxID=2976982 RepID=UPI00246837EC|nr:hypothetical protein [Pigmentibacter sp. JX0631]WGL61525.1 hypothetical protein QEJ31_07965 [Pigmentibacter sp. JX0631]
MLKNKFIKRFFLLFVSLFIVFPSHSDEKSTNKEIVNNEAQDLISEKFLDSLWNNRENTDGENQIYLFLSKETPIPKEFNIAWKVARLVYFYGNFTLSEATPKLDKIKLFKYGYEAGKIAKELEPKKVEGYYWYAINLGSYGLSKGIFSALSNAKPGRDALLEAAKIDPKYQWCGPLRILGRYYQEVPGGLISFGDKKIAEDYFNQAIQTCPEFRLNTMYLGILKKKSGDKTIALELFKKAQTLPEVDGKNEEKRYSKELAENIKSVQNM